LIIMGMTRDVEEDLMISTRGGLASTPEPALPPRLPLLLSAVPAYVGALWLHTFYHLTGGRQTHELPLMVLALRDGTLALPVVLMAVTVAVVCSGRLLRATPSATAVLGVAVTSVLAAGAAAVALATGNLVNQLVFGQQPLSGLSLPLQVVRDAVVVLAVCLPVAAAVVLFEEMGHQFFRSTIIDDRIVATRGQRPRGQRERARRPARVYLAGATATVLIAFTGLQAGAVGAGAAPAAAAAAAPSGVCAGATRTINYNVNAFGLDLPLNGWGDHIPDGLMYALSNPDAQPTIAQIKAEPGRSTPLVLRAAVGDCIKVHFTNEIAGRRVGMHVDGVAKDVNDSDGAHIGNNPDTTVPTSGQIDYTWFAQREGQFPVNDYGSGTSFGTANPSPDTTSHGLYGGLVVLPAGSTWHNPVTGTDLITGADNHGIGAPLFVDVHVPGVGNDFRDYAQILADEPEGILDPTGAKPTFPTTGLADASFFFNYRTEPLRNRLRAVLQHQAGKTVTMPNGTVILPADHFCDGFTNDQDTATNTARLARDLGSSGCLGEESHLQSWAFGDPGKMTKATNERDTLKLAGATGGTYTLSVKDPTLTGSLTADGAAVDQSQPRFSGEQTRTAPIAFDASASDVQAALDQLQIVSMSPGHLPATGDISVSGVAGNLDIAFAQHFAGKDVDIAVDGSRLTADPTASATADVSDATTDGGTKGAIEVLSDTLLPKAYRGDPLHMRLIHPGIKETHPFHQHTNRWRLEANDPQSTRLDVQSIGPGQSFDLFYEGGAGEAITSDPRDPAAGAKSMDEWVRAGRPDLAALAISKASNGDHIFHCHLYPHFAQGFWAALRVFDRQRPLDPALWPAGTPRTYADATPIEPLAMLPDFDFTAINPVTGATVSMTPMPDAAHAGYPLMLKGEYGQRAYRAPGAVVADRYGAASLNWRRPGDTLRDYGSAATTDLERANMVTTTDAAGARHAVPGAFFINPCPVGEPVREYHPTAIDAKIVYNKAGWNDPGGKMYVEAPPSDPADPTTSIDVADKIRAKINAGTVQPEPYNIRTRLGECVNMRTTNATNLDNNTSIPIDVHDGQISASGALTGGNAFHPPTLMSELSTHVHLVRFDELATDGTSVGWNYVQAPMVGQTWNYKWFADLALRTVYFHDHQNPNTHQQHGLWAAMNVEPNSSTFNDPRTGALLVPPYCNGLALPSAPQAGSPAPACYGVGSVSDIRVPTDAATGVNASFREFTVNYSDFVPMRDAAGMPINAPGAPDQYASDQGGMGINYRNEPFPTRVNSASKGAKREPAYVFSSAVHGDPSTPIFRAYSKDPVIFRFMGGAHEEGHNFTLAGHRWLSEPDDAKSNLMDSQFVMISEWFNFEISGTQIFKRGTREQAVKKARIAGLTTYGSEKILPGGAGAPGDYLYSSQPLNDLWMGMWGIFRVPRKRLADLQPLPSNAPSAAGLPGAEWPALQPGQGIAPAPAAGNPCPVNAPNQNFRVSVVQQKIVYNTAGDNDPNGLAYVLDKDLTATGKPKAGTALKPLFIRANEGDCVHIFLTNRLPATGVKVGPGDPINPVEGVGAAGTSTVTNSVGGVLQTVKPAWPAGNRASMHVSGLVRDLVTKSDGAAVGYNWDSTVAPGATIPLHYYVDTKNIGVANLSDYGNLRGSRHHGLWGGLVVEPKGASYLNPKDLTALPAGEQAVIKYPEGTTTRSYREFMVDVQDGLNLFDKNGLQVPDMAAPDVPGAAVDAEDQGEGGVNYRSEPFLNRLAPGKDAADVLSSSVFGDPATPVFRAYPNDPAYVRVLNSQDLPRVHTFGITGHSWKYEPNDANTNVINGQGGLNTGRAFNVGICAGSNTPLSFGASGLTATCASDGIAGDYLYNDRNLFLLPSGVWGLMRVHGSPQSDLKPLPTS
jgi:hypothetical protein